MSSTYFFVRYMNPFPNTFTLIPMPASAWNCPFKQKPFRQPTVKGR